MQITLIIWEIKWEIISHGNKKKAKGGVGGKDFFFTQ